MVPKTTAYKRWNCQVIRPANCCHLNPSNRFLHGFPDPSQFAAAKLTHYSTMPHPRSPHDIGNASCSQVMCTRILALLPSIHVPCVQATVHSKCSGLQNAAEYRRIKNWACSSCSSPPTLPIQKPLPSPITTKASDGDPITIPQFKTNGIVNKQVKLGEFLERHEVKVAVIQESKVALNSRTPNIQKFTTVRKDRDQGQGGGLHTLIHNSVNFSRG